MSELVTRGPAPIASLSFLRGYLVTMRPYLLYVSGISGIAGLSLAPDLPVSSVLLLSLAFFLSYGFGQALTDCFQLDTDTLSAPYRPLVRGELRRTHVMAVSLAGLSAIGGVLISYNPWNAPLAAAAVTGLATYTYFKRRWWGGPLYNAWIVAVLALIGYLSGLGRAGEPATSLLPLLGTLAVVLFGYANFVLTGYYKDISADRATGYRTLPVVFGMRVAARVSHLFAALTVLACGVVAYPALAAVRLTTEGGLAVGFLAAGTVASLIAQLRLHGVGEEQQAHRAITPVVHAYILLLAGIAAAYKPHWAPALVLFYLGFLATLNRRPMREQI
jgi:4-hydroxybenzoate polyprenyltransferase